MSADPIESTSAFFASLSRKFIVQSLHGHHALHVASRPKVGGHSHRRLGLPCPGIIHLPQKLNAAGYSTRMASLERRVLTKELYACRCKSFCVLCHHRSCSITGHSQPRDMLCGFQLQLFETCKGRLPASSNQSPMGLVYANGKCAQRCPRGSLASTVNQNSAKLAKARSQQHQMCRVIGFTETERGRERLHCPFSQPGL